MAVFNLIIFLLREKFLCFFHLWSGKTMMFKIVAMHYLFLGSTRWWILRSQ